MQGCDRQGRKRGAHHAGPEAGIIASCDLPRSFYEPLDCSRFEGIVSLNCESGDERQASSDAQSIPLFQQLARGMNRPGI